jgi:hypothetical protein
MPSKATLHLYRWTTEEEQEKILNSMEEDYQAKHLVYQDLYEKYKEENGGSSALDRSNKYYDAHLDAIREMRSVKLDLMELTSFYSFLDVTKKPKIADEKLADFVSKAPMRESIDANSYYWIRLMDSLQRD